MTLYKYVSSHWHEKITYCYQFNIYFFIALQRFLIKIIKYIDFRGENMIIRYLIIFIPCIEYSIILLI